MIDQRDRREPPKHDHEQEQQNGRQQEIRHRKQHQRHDRERVVARPVAADRLDDRRQHRQRQIEQEGIAREDHCVEDAGRQDVGDRSARNQRLPEIAGHEMRQPVPVADDRRIVEAELDPQRVQGLRRRVTAEDTARDVARQNFQHEENDQRDEEQRQQRKQDARCDELQDRQGRLRLAPTGTKRKRPDADPEPASGRRVEFTCCSSDLQSSG